MLKILNKRYLSNLKNLRCYSSAGLPKITLPKDLEDGGLDRLAKKYRQKNDKLYRGDLFVQGNTRIPIITSKFKPNLNHYYNQRYRKGSCIRLASEGWKHSLKYDGDIIEFMPFERNQQYLKLMSKNRELKSPTAISFESLGIRPELCKNLKNNFKIYEPNEAQVNTIPKVMSGINVRCCFETGTGKTISYLLPIIERILKQKETENKTMFIDDFNQQEFKQPKAIIIVPSRELGYQTYEVIRKLTEGLNFGVATILGGKPLHIKHTGYDIVITSIGMFQANLKKGMYSLDKVKHLIIDEVDTMCDSSFKKELSYLLDSFSYVNIDNPNACQMILVSATFPKYVYDVIGDHIDLNNISVATSKNVNQLLFNVKHTFYRVNFRSREQKLIDLCFRFERSPGQTMIFTNRLKAAVFLSYHLNQNDIDCTLFVKGNSDTRFHNFLDFQSGKSKFLVCTDLGSRGLDISNVQHIINYDCPRWSTDYVHRAGRTGRINSENERCSIHTFVSFDSDVQMLQELERSIRENTEIEGINLDIKGFYNTRHAARNLDREDEEEDEF